MKQGSYLRFVYDCVSVTRPTSTVAWNKELALWIKTPVSLFVSLAIPKIVTAVFERVLAAGKGPS